MQTMIFEPWDVVVVPFPFIDSPKTKRRKAIVLSKKEFAHENTAYVLMMITSAENSQWSGDVPIKSIESAGLNKTCFARMKIFTLQANLVFEKVGKIQKGDKENIKKELRTKLDLI